MNREKIISLLIAGFRFIVLCSPALAADEMILQTNAADGVFSLKSTENNTIYFFEKDTFQWSYEIPEKIWSSAISTDGAYVAIGSEGGLIWLFDQKGAVVWNKSFGNGAIRSIEFSKDSRYLDASNFMNQAFFISRDGNPAARPTTSRTTEIPSGTVAVTAGQVPVDLDFSWLTPLVTGNLFLIIGVIASHCRDTLVCHFAEEKIQDGISRFGCGCYYFEKFHYSLSADDTGGISARLLPA